MTAISHLKRGITALTITATLFLSVGAAFPAADKEIVINPRPVAKAPTCKPKPKDCTVIGRVTGFQVQVGSKRGATTVPVDGRIVSWSTTLGDPGKHKEFFDGIFGKGAQARIATLRQVESKPGRYRLLGQSEPVDLEPFFGSSPAFQLSRSLRVRRGDVVALTVPTWAPLFAVNESNADAWRADRSSKKCNDVKKGTVHKRGDRPYDCLFRTAQLIYSAVLVPNS